MATFTVHAAKTNLSRLIAAAESGGEVIIARGDKAVVKLVPCEPAASPDLPLVALPPRRPGRLKGLISIDERFFEPLSEEELGCWEGKYD